MALYATAISLWLAVVFDRYFYTLKNTSCNAHLQCSVCGCIQRLQQLNNGSGQFSGTFTNMIRLITFAYHGALSTEGSFTLFAVTDDGFTKAMSSSEA